MADSVLFRPFDDGTWEWVKVGGAAATLRHGVAEELAAACAGNRAVLVADGIEVTLTHATVPSRQRSTVVRAVPFALEDQFADDVGELHFAIGDRLDGDNVDVAVVRHETLRRWLRMCADAGVSVAAVVPEQLLLPRIDDDWSLVGDGQRIVARTGRWGGFVADRATFEIFGQFAMRQEDGEARRAHLFGDLEPADIAPIDGLELVPTDSRLVPLHLYAQQNAPYTKLSLLQGPYSPRAKIGRVFRPWRPAAVLVGVLLCLQLGLYVAQKVQLEGQSRDLRAEMERIYREAFPDARKVVDPRLQMDRRLREMRKGSSSGDVGVLALISVAGPVVRASEGLEIRGLTYRNGEMVLNIVAESLQRIDKLRADLLERGGLDVEIQSASSREGQVNSRLLIRGATG